ncbi:Cyclin-D1-1 [Platanthera zijinensis]|uniref:Cyclin-D1-1 n=1 Tax=Platanthera zijinensis TaxID=2320716 RepID=A0AAP0BEK4_9ASPA
MDLSLYCAEDSASWDTDAGVDSGDDWCPALDLQALLSAETEQMPNYDYLFPFHPHSLHSTVRQDCINWILKVTEFYDFRPVTAYLSVIYLDRFLSANSLPQAGHGGWPMQLLSVACLSIAAKMEETDVPLLLDLQILEPKFVFEPKAIGRMELALMAALRWRMRSITPFDFLPHFAAIVLPCIVSSSPALFSRAGDLIVSTRRGKQSKVVDFLKFRPSAIAAAAVLCVAEELSGYSSGDDRDCLGCFSAWDVLGTCCQLMNQYLIDTCPAARSKPSVDVPTPRSPVGVLDAAACGSCDSQRSSSDAVMNGEVRPPKRRRYLGTPCTE